MNGAVQALIDGRTVEVDKLPLSSLTLAHTGDLSVQFGLKELGLLAGFEEHGMRRVRRIAVTLPALLGPTRMYGHVCKPVPQVCLQVVTRVPFPMACMTVGCSHRMEPTRIHAGVPNGCRSRG